MTKETGSMKRENFGSKFGVLAAAAGSAIGLGNIWRFPYIAGKNGGAAFIFVYIIFVIIMGTPLMISELVLGRHTRSNSVGAYKVLRPNSKWKYTGILAVVTSFIILSFYSIIAGWVFTYLQQSFTGKLIKVVPDQLESYFVSLSSNASSALFWNAIVIGLTAFIVISGIKNGIEKYSKVLMPILFFTLVALMIRSLTLDGAKEGLKFLFKPDFSQLTTKSLLEALGHAFYSLSLGMGIIITYGSYINREENLVSLSLQIITADTLMALMSGMVIFPAVFAYGFEPQSGPSLIFITLPAVFQAMPLGAVFETLFFLLVGIASITSTISLLEVSVSFVTEEFKINRKKATALLALGVFILSIPSTLSFGVWSEVQLFGKNIFDFMDFMASYAFLTIGGCLTCIFVGWVWGSQNAFQELTNDGAHPMKGYKIYNFIIKFIAPIAIGLIFLYSTGIIKL